ncbi:ACP phosphodiesterase [Algoriphagus sp. CAU 1675]|uniref:acyl carrier protein phosphodiesterase n=1 Tax=Algoriphagus sp. CAU 1675 TaxID=3032597 RepID=UPI0023DB47FD|nr:ACP phosphodiesterase [Algoriphagus sp. CAU 1675]MDF2158606.1 ACP phosphodiesterase [Algoriphagus sp. CAU 1675]
MNFLAHAYLSFRQEKILVGNFIADFVKGRQINDFPIEIRMGIFLHREIDTFTDTHPLVKAGQTFLRPECGHYASVITDIFFDYLLIKHWKNFSDISLEDFIQKTYDTLDKNSDWFPERFSAMYYWMRKDNWLYNYGSIRGVQQTLTGMSKRTRFESKMENAHLMLLEKEAEFEVIFFTFFRDLETFALEKLKEIKKAHDFD